MNFDKLNEMSNVVKYENFNKWKDGQSYKVKKMTSDIVIKYITNVAIKYVLNYAFERYTEDEKNNIIV